VLGNLGPRTTIFDREFASEGANHREYRIRRISTTARVVCGGCNNGWMARLEGRARLLFDPLISGAPVPTKLSPEHQLLAATWIVKTAMIADFVAGRAPVFTQAQRTLMLEQLVPPHEAPVHLAAQDATVAKDRPVRWLAVDGHMNQAATSQDRPDGFIAAIGLGEFVILLAVSPWKGYVALKGAGERRRTWFSALSPMSPSASWPLPKRLRPRSAPTQLVALSLLGRLLGLLGRSLTERACRGGLLGRCRLWIRQRLASG
jgi:hypothetical protein